MGMASCELSNLRSIAPGWIREVRRTKETGDGDDAKGRDLILASCMQQVW